MDQKPVRKTARPCYTRRLESATGGLGRALFSVRHLRPRAGSSPFVSVLSVMLRRAVEDRYGLGAVIRSALDEGPQWAVFSRVQMAEMPRFALT